MDCRAVKGKILTLCTEQLMLRGRAREGRVIVCFVGGIES
jgi:hypothetical protein